MKTAFEPIELVVFDMDGVLVDSTACHTWAFEQLWAECELPLPDYPQYADIAGRTTREVVIEHTAGLSPQTSQIDQWVAFKQSRALECFERRDIVYPDVRSALAGLRERGFAIALGTGASRSRTHVLLERLGASDWFRSVITAEDVAHGKPDPETYRLAIERAGGSPERSIVVEDSTSGVASALAAGARVASVRTGVRCDDPRFVGDYRDLEAFASSLTTVAPAEKPMRHGTLL